MKFRLTIKIDPKSVGQAFAYTDDESQATMLNEMGLELKACCGRDLGMQVCAFSKHLDNNGKHLIEQIKSFIDLRKEDKEYKANQKKEK